MVGGHTPAAYRRAVEQGNGWYGFALDLNHTADCLTRLREAREQYDRPSEPGELEISVTPRISLTRAAVNQFAELGVHRLIVMPPSSLNELQLQEFVTNIGETLI